MMFGGIKVESSGHVALWLSVVDEVAMRVSTSRLNIEPASIQLSSFSSFATDDKFTLAPTAHPFFRGPHDFLPLRFLTIACTVSYMLHCAGCQELYGQPLANSSPVGEAVTRVVS